MKIGINLFIYVRMNTGDDNKGQKFFIFLLVAINLAIVFFIILKLLNVIDI